MVPATGQIRPILHAIGGLAVAALLSGAASPNGAGCVSVSGTQAKSLARTGGFKAPPPGASLYGHVYTVDGAPVAGATVRTVAISNTMKVVSGKTDSSGRYVLKGLAPGAVGVVVEHKRFGKVGPLPVRLWESMQAREEAQPQQVDIGGLGDGSKLISRTQTGKTLYVRTVTLSSKVRRFTPDGRGGMLALTADGVVRVSPQRSPNPLVRIPAPMSARAAGTAPASTKVSGPGVPASDLFVGTHYGTFGDTGVLARYRQDGRQTWCLDLPVKPAEVGVSGDGMSWLIGTNPTSDLAIRVTPGGRPANVFRLATGSTFDVAVDRTGHAWVVNGTEGIVRVDSTGRNVKHITLPAPVKSLYTTPDGGVWSVGGGVASRFDKDGRALARLVRKSPIVHSAVDGEGVLWMFEDKALYAVDGRTVTRHSLQGKVLPQTMSMAGDDGSHLWLLGPDRMTAAIVNLPCDCGSGKH